MKEDAPQREHSMRSIYNALRYMVRVGCTWRMILNDLAPQYTLQQRTQRWIKAGCFEAMAHGLRKVLRLVADQDGSSSTVFFDRRAIQSASENNRSAGHDDYMRGKRSKDHAAVDKLGHLLRH